MYLFINRLTASILGAGCLVAWFLQLIALSPISPNPLILQHAYKREGPFAHNDVLQVSVVSVILIYYNEILLSIVLGLLFILINC
jgi:hypothetical protein